eukprot:GEMP01043817.1.p1 GENE.GEMP01043817.1~~GEMP01043817.1.p1  ORF type:complete len:181 (+),score=30.13 GEMP01043817.1:93-635(+)
MTNSQDESTVKESVVKESTLKHGDLSYYHAHQRPREDVSGAKLIEGKGLAAPSAVQLKPGDDGYVERPIESKVCHIDKHMFADEKDKVKVYLDFPPGVLREAKVEVDFWDLGLEARIILPELKMVFLVCDQPFHEKIIPEKSSWRINSSQTKLVLSLAKIMIDDWPQLVKKNLSAATGWK